MARATGSMWDPVLVCSLVAVSGCWWVPATVWPLAQGSGWMAPAWWSGPEPELPWARGMDWAAPACLLATATAWSLARESRLVPVLVLVEPLAPASECSLGLVSRSAAPSGPALE